MAECRQCGDRIPAVAWIGSRRVDLRRRQRCLICLPHRPLIGARKAVERPAQIKHCDACGLEFSSRIEVAGKMRPLYRRRFCFGCSPFGGHNTSKAPPGGRDAGEIAAERRRRRNETSYRSQKKRRRQLKDELIAARGGRCCDCGYSASAAALEFHHRDAATKRFEIGAASASRDRKRIEASKCDLVCANCHRARHAIAARSSGAPVVEFRRRTKQKAVALLGGRCRGCDREFAASTFEFHHLDAGTKDFSISDDGIPRPWERITAELAKCVLVCANCHREIHAGMRVIAADGPAIGEALGPYRSAVA